LAVPDQSYRALERICRTEASLTTDRETRKALEAMARKYGDMADNEERQQKSKE
jgi:hypothetical protein